MQAFSCQRGGFLILEDIAACAFKRDSKLIRSCRLAGRIPGNCCGDTSHRAERQDWRRGLFPQISAAIRWLSLASLLVPENLYPVFRETEMRSSAVRLPANSLAPDEALRPDLSDLKIAKARQDVSHQKLDKWIAAAIAELSDERRAA
jgi:hypothetical protein